MQYIALLVVLGEDVMTSSPLTCPLKLGTLVGFFFSSDALSAVMKFGLVNRANIVSNLFLEFQFS